MQRVFKSRRNVAWLAVVVASTVSLVLPSYAQPPEAASSNEPLFKVTRKKSNLRIIERFAKVIELKNKITRVDGFDPEIIEVNAMTPNQIRVQAVTPGITTMVIVDETDTIYSIDVFVTGDVRHLQAYINNLFPNEAVQAIAVRESVVLRGWVTQPEHINELEEIAEQFFPHVLNQIRVGGVQQVMLKVKVMEIQRSKMRQLGFNFLFTHENNFVNVFPGNLISGGGAGLAATFGIFNGMTSFQGFVEALRQEGLLKILSEPSLVVNNGRPAILHNGGEFPILVPQSLGTVTIDWREFGTILEAVPIVLGDGRLRLDLKIEVSERDFSNSVILGSTVVPGLTTRRAETQVEMKFGQTLMIAGLLATRETATTFKIPLFGELPWIGAVFRRTQNETVETELVIMVTPEFVAPMNSEQVPKGGPGRFTDTPTDRELFAQGLLEVPKYGERCEGCPAPLFKPMVPQPQNPMPIAPPAPTATAPVAPAPDEGGFQNRDSFEPNAGLFRNRTRNKASIRQTNFTPSVYRRPTRSRPPSRDLREPSRRNTTGALPRNTAPRRGNLPGLIEPSLDLIKPNGVSKPQLQKPIGTSSF